MAKAKRKAARRAPRAPKPDPTVFIHVVALDKQYSVQAVEGKPLSLAIADAFKFHGKSLPAKVVIRTGDEEQIQPTKTPKALGLKHDQVVYVRTVKADKEIQTANEKAQLLQRRIARGRKQNAKAAKQSKGG